MEVRIDKKVLNNTARKSNYQKFDPKSVAKSKQMEPKKGPKFAGRHAARLLRRELRRLRHGQNAAQNLVGVGDWRHGCGGCGIDDFEKDNEFSPLPMSLNPQLFLSLYELWQQKLRNLALKTLPRRSNSRGHLWRPTGAADRRRADNLGQWCDADVDQGELAVDPPPRGHGQRGRLLRPLQTGMYTSMIQGAPSGRIVGLCLL